MGPIANRFLLIIVFLTLLAGHLHAQAVPATNVEELYASTNDPQTIEIKGEGSKKGIWQAVEFLAGGFPFDPSTSNLVAIIH